MEKKINTLADLIHFLYDMLGLSKIHITHITWFQRNKMNRIFLQFDVQRFLILKHDIIQIVEQRKSSGQKWLLWYIVLFWHYDWCREDRKIMDWRKWQIFDNSSIDILLAIKRKWRKNSWKRNRSKNCIHNLTSWKNMSISSSKIGGNNFEGNFCLIKSSISNIWIKNFLYRRSTDKISKRIKIDNLEYAEFFWDLLHLLTRNTKRPESPDNGAHTCSCDHFWLNFVFFQTLDKSYMSDSTSDTTAESQSKIFVFFTSKHSIKYREKSQKIN